MDRLTEAARKPLVLRAAVLLRVWALDQQTQVLRCLKTQPQKRLHSKVLFLRAAGLYLPLS